MELQRVFKDSYIDYLRNHINIADYQADEFPYDIEKTKFLANVYKPVGLLERLDPADDFTTAVELFKAYQNLSPLVASMPNLWVYLSHVDLFNYVQRRWSKVKDSDVDVQYIENHWHEQKGKFLRTSFAGLWWHVYLSYDETRKNPFELTEVLFKSQDFRTLRFGELGLIRHRAAMIGVLEFLLENSDVMKNAFDARGQYISKYFNMLGGVKSLAFMPKEYFKQQLMDLKPKLLSITSINDVQNKEVQK